MKKLLFLLLVVSFPLSADPFLGFEKWLETQSFKEISAENPIHRLFFLESALVTPPRMQEAYQMIDRIFLSYKKEESADMSAREKLDLLFEFLQKETQYQEDLTLLSQSLYLKKRDCDLGSFVFLAIAFELKWPLYGVMAPEHFFVRWQTEEELFNYETTSGSVIEDSHYIKEENIAEISLKNGIFMRNINWRELEGLFLENTATALFTAGYSQDALDLFNQSLILYPQLPASYVNRAAVYNDLGKYTLAEEDCLKAIEMDPHDAEAFANLGNAFYYQKKYNNALKSHNKAISINREKAVFYANRGVVFMAMENYSAARSDFSRALRIKDDYAEVFAHLAFIYAITGQFSSAMEYLKKANQLKPDNTEKDRHSCAIAFFNRGTDAYNRKDYQEALRAYQYSENCASTFKQFYAPRARVLVMLDRWQEAIKDYKKAIELFPQEENQTKEKMAYSLYNRALAFQNRKDWEKAIFYYQRSLEIKSDFKEAAYNLAVIYYNQAVKIYNEGKKEQSMPLFRKAVKMAPSIKEDLPEAIRKEL